MVGATGIHREKERVGSWLDEQPLSSSRIIIIIIFLPMIYSRHNWHAMKKAGRSKLRLAFVICHFVIFRLFRNEFGGRAL
jgi:hypothetical protein